MQLREPFFETVLGQDQPYNALLLISPFCKFICEGCHNLHLDSKKVEDFKVVDLAKKVNEDPFLEGITVSGLEIFDSGIGFQHEIADLIKTLNEGKRKVTIYTRYSKSIPMVFNFLHKIEPFCEELYLKHGSYASELPTKEVKIDNWTLTLASDNQNFEKLKG